MESRWPDSFAGSREDRFIGRERELATLESAIDAAVRGHGRLVVIGGEPGIGKTRTAEEVGRLAQQRGAQVVWGHCHEGEGAPPFWPWVQVLRAYPPGALHEQLIAAAGTDLVRLLPDDGDPDRSVASITASPAARFRLYDAVARCLAGASRQRPVVAVFDDLHAADHPSLLLLEFVASQLCEMRVLVVATWRSTGGVLPNRTLVDALRAAGSVWMHLNGWSAAEVGQFIEARVGVPLGPTQVNEFRQRTGGNPLFVGEDVRLLQSRGPAALPDWSCAELGVPPTIQSIIEQRLDSRSAACREVLRVAAVIGPEFTPRLVGAVLASAPPPRDGGWGGRRWEDDAVTVLLGEAEGAGIVAGVPGAMSRYRFTHDVIREALCKELGVKHRAQLHRCVGELLEALPDADERQAELAHHFVEALSGDSSSRARAIVHTRRAGEHAMAALAYEDAVRFYQLAIDLLSEPGTAHEGDHCAMLVELGVAQRQAGEWERSAQTLLRAAEAAKRLGRPELLARAALHFGTDVVWGEQMMPNHARLQLLEDAIAAQGDGDSGLQVRLLVRLALAARFSAEPERRMQVSRRALAMARRLDDAALIAETLHAWLASHWCPDNLDERQRYTDEMAVRAEQAHAVELVLLALSWRWMALMERGEVAAARALGASYETLIATCHDPMHRWWRVLARAVRQLQDGSFAQAQASIHESLSLEQAVNQGPPWATLALQAALWCTQGCRDALQAVLDNRPVGSGHMPYVVDQCWSAYVACELDNESRARSQFERLAAHEFADLPTDETWLSVMPWLVEVCVFLDDAPRAERLLDLLSPYETRVLINPMSKVYVGPVSQLLALLETTLARWDHAARHFEQALRTHREVGAPPALARTQYAYARMLLARGQPDDRRHAAALLDVTLATATQLEMPLLIERVETLKNSKQTAIDEQPPPTTAANHLAHLPAAAVFRCDGDYWTVAAAGTVLRLKNSRGLQYLAHLLRHPGREILALDLVPVGAPPAPGDGPQPDARGASSGVGPLIDAPARAAYKERLEELRDALTEAEAHNDPGRATRVRAEMDVLVAHLRGALGLGGRDRRAGGDLERARSAVGKRIRAEIKRIHSAHPAVGRHLSATVTTGYFCTYQPERDVTVQWEL